MQGLMVLRGTINKFNPSALFLEFTHEPGQQIIQCFLFCGGCPVIQRQAWDSSKWARGMGSSEQVFCFQVLIQRFRIPDATVKIYFWWHLEQVVGPVGVPGLFKILVTLDALFVHHLFRFQLV